MKKNKISIVLICLNDEDCIEDMLKSITGSDYHELIVVDGGSEDQTKIIARKYTNDFFETEKGMLNQAVYGIKKAKGKFIFLAESDHVYPKRFLDSLYMELMQSNYDGIWGTLKYDNPTNFWERGHDQFLKIHFHKKGLKEIIACPQLWHKDKLELLLKKTKNANGFSFDTQRAEEAKDLKLKVGLGYTIAFEKQSIDFNKFLERHSNYGNGDYEFYKNNRSQWDFKRKVKSISHVFFRYGIVYPIKSIYIANPFLAIPYFWLLMITRYQAWIRNYF